MNADVTNKNTQPTRAVQRNFDFPKGKLDFADLYMLNRVQLDYLKSILDYVSVNSDINGQILTNK